MWLRCVLALLAAMFGVSVWAAPDAALEGDWFGQWQATGDAELVVRIDGEEFSLRLEGDGPRLPQTKFEIGGRDGVFNGITPSGMLDWLSLTREPGPLEGQPLIWARTLGSSGVSVYHFKLAESGLFNIDQFRLTPTAEGAVLEAIRTGPAGPAVVERAELRKR